jgi:RimJ/RimL family protein N-acetyltransferase
VTAFPDVRLATPRLDLRPLGPADAPALYAVFSDPRVMRYWCSGPWTAVAEAEARIARQQEALAAGEFLALGIVRRDDGLLLGTCTLFHLSAQCRRAELGYGLRPDAWGHGYAAEAVGELLRFGFTDLALHRVEADVDPRNEASVRLLERLGFTREGLLRERWIVEGEISDAAFYGLLRREWEARRAAPPVPFA